MPEGIFCSGQLHLISVCVCVYFSLTRQLRGAQHSLDSSYFRLALLFCVDTENRMRFRLLRLSWNTKSWPSSVSHAPYQRNGTARLLLSAFTQHVFSLSFALPIFERHCFYKSSDRANQFSLKYVCVCGFCDLWEEIPELCGVTLATLSLSKCFGVSRFSFSPRI